jgi:protein involved in polysaccharide export with SLBB domain
VTVEYQTSSQDVLLTFNSTVILQGVSTNESPDFYVSSDPCVGFVPAGTQCTVTVIFKPYLPGWGSAQAPIGRWAPLQVVYYDFSLSRNVYVNFPLTGTGTHPQAVVTPGTISDLIGNDVTPQAGYAGDGGPASGAQFVTPAAVAMDVMGNIYIADTGNNVVRLYYQQGTFPEIAGPLVAGNVYTIAGIGPTGGVSNGGAGTDGVLATQSALNGPAGVALDAAGNLYISDTNNQAVRMVSATTGIITTIAGTLNANEPPGTGFSGDLGPATAAQLYIPVQIAVDGYGNVFIADAGNDAVRVVYAGGTAIANLIATEIAGTTAVVGDIYTIAGGPTNGPAANNGDAGLAALADLDYPSGVAVDSLGDVFIADSLNNAVRRVDVMSGNISTVYSSGKPVSLSVDASDDIYITLPQSCGVLEYSPTANAGLAIPMSTVVAGDGACAALGDGGSATAASLSGAAGVVADGGGNLYVLEPDGVRLVANASAPLNFGSVNVGSTSPAQSVILTNGDILQSGPSTGTQGTALGLTTGGTPFSIVPYLMANPNILDCDANNYSLSPGQSCGASFTFSPINDGGPFTNFAFSQAGVGVNLTGMGTGPLPTVTLTGGPLSFTAVAKETTSASQPLYLKNTSNITLYMQYPYFTSSYGVFKETDHCGFSSGVQTPTLAPGATCEIDITFSPNAPGPFTGTFNLPDNASTGDGTQTVSLSGTGLAPVGTFSVSEVIITALPGATATEAFNLTNTGTAPLNINPYWVITGNDPARFAVLSSTCGSVLAIGAYCTVTVSFSPLTYAYYSADVSVQDDNGGAPIITQNGVSTFYYNTQTLHMVGETGLPSRTALYYQTNYTFGTVPIGQSATQTVTVELNTSQKLQSIGVMTGFTEFTVGTITGCVIDGVTLNPIGTTCQVPVTFTPQWPGFRTAPMVVTDVEGTVGIPYTFPLTGIGAGSVAAMTPGIISTVVGGANGHAAGIVGADGPAKQAEVSFINGYAIDPIGNQFISDTENEVIWKVDTAGKIHLYAGTPWPYGGYAQGVEGDGGTALGAEIGYAGPLALDSRGGLYLGDNNGNNYGQPTELRYIDSATNSIINFVGFTTPATWSPSTGFGPTNRLQVNVNGTTYLFTAFTGGTTGSSAPSWPTSAGTGVFDGTMEWINQGVYYGRAGCAAQTDSWGDGCPASEATVGTVGGITLDRGGNLFFSDTGYVTSNSGIVTYHSMIRRVDATTKVVTLFAGNGTYGYTGDGGTATSAEVTAGELAFDSKGNLYFSDGGGTILRRVDATTGFISTFAGQEVYSAQQNYCSGGGGDEGPASAATFANLSSLVIDAADDIYLVDGSSCHVRRIDAATGTIHNVAGLPGTYGYYGPGYGDSNQSGSDGDATQAFLNQPGFVRLDGQANMYIASAFGGVRKIDVTQSVLNFTGSASTNNAFSQQAVNTVSAAQTATVLNAGNGGALGFTTPFLAAPAWGISSSNFLRDVTSPTGSADCYTRLSISQGSICPVNVDFGPLSGSGWLTGIDTVNDTPTAGTATQPIALYGNAGGTTPLVTLTPFLLSFSVAQGATSAPQTLTLTNNDVNPLPISSITITGAGSTAFGQVNNCGTSLAAISSCIIEVVFSPPVLPGSGTGGPPPDLLQATVTITDTAGTSPQTAQMTGVGTLPAMGEPGLTPDIEEIHISDTVSLVPSTLLAITETITVSDGMPSTVPSTLLPIYETVHVTDSERGLAGTTPTATTTSLIASATLITAGGSVNLTATVMQVGSTMLPTGSVNFYENGLMLGSATIANGVAVYSTPALIVGSYSFQATFPGSSVLAASSSATVTVSVASGSPAITSVSAILPQQTQTITINGSDFGTQAAYTGDSNYIELIDSTGTSWNAGHGSSAVTLAVSSWTNTQIVLSGLSGAYGTNGWCISPGDQLSVKVWNAQSGHGPAVYPIVASSGTNMCALAITSVSPILPQQTQTITINGSDFGTQSAYTGDSNYIELVDSTGVSWDAGHSGAAVTLAVSSWTNTQIVLTGFSSGYGTNGWCISPGDQLSVKVWNAQSGHGPAVYPIVASSGTNTCTVAITSVSAILPQQTQTITINGTGFGTQSAYTGDSKYIELADTTAHGWNAGHSGAAVTLAVSSWTDTQIVLTGLSGSYGTHGWCISPGDQLSVKVWNAQTGLGPAVYPIAASSGTDTCP